jgi:H+/Cl- antiporter ClcA
MTRLIPLTALSVAAGVLAGLAASVFLHLLALATGLRLAYGTLIYFLPVAGLFIGWAYHRHAGRAARGHNLILDEIHEPRELVPARMAPFVLLGTLLTHLCGGSAGREGTAVQMGASLADQLGRFVKLAPAERRALLMAGAGAGFGAAIGAPVAGVVFGMEVIHSGRFRVSALWECLVASSVAFAVTHLTLAPHTLYPAVKLPGFEWILPLAVAAAGVAFGFTARAFVALEHILERGFALLPYPPARTFLGGLLLVPLFFLVGDQRYCGLGLETIQAALRGPAPFLDPVLKLGFTALTLAAGFKGGEFIPLVFIGTTLGSAIAAVTGLPLSLFASLGFAAVFGAGANTPIACAVMAAELFGPGILPWALLCCYVAYLVSGHPGIYRTQPKQ